MGEYWASTVRPGMQLSMSLDNISWKDPGTHNLVCFELGQRARGRVVKFRTPLPTWAAASYPEDAEFKLGYVKLCAYACSAAFDTDF
jgi:hypothetical protein